MDVRTAKPTFWSSDKKPRLVLVEREVIDAVLLAVLEVVVVVVVLVVALDLATAGPACGCRRRGE